MVGRGLWIAVAGALWLVVAAPALSEDFRSGLSAYNRGDHVAAFRQWLALAERGDAKAQAGLGYLFHKGLGVAVDDVEAAHWLEKAARQGQAEGQMLLGTLYLDGRGVAQSDALAFVWCELAQSEGQEEASFCRDEALRRLGAEAMAESRRLVAEWSCRFGRGGR